MAKRLMEIFEMTDEEMYAYYQEISYADAREILLEMLERTEHEMKELAMVYREVFNPTLH